VDCNERTTSGRRKAAGTVSRTASDRRLRVLFVPQSYPPLSDQKSANGTFCREHVRAAARNDDVAVLVYTTRRERWPTLAWKRLDDEGIPTFYAAHGRSPIPGTTRHFFRLYLRRAIHRAIREWGRPDVIHTQDGHAYYVIKAAQDLDVPFVISQHWSVFLKRRVDRTTLSQFQWAFARAARVLPANRWAATDYEHYGLQASVTWLPNALDTEIFRPPEGGDREPWLVHASGLDPDKGTREIIHAFARVRAVRPQAVLHVAGAVHRAEMEALAARTLPADSFQFHGFLAKPALAELMRWGRGFVLPSAFETFGCVLMEAMACGCPVLTTRVGGIPAVVRKGEGLFVQVGNIDQIAAGMIHLIDGSHGLDMARISRETRERFSHETVGQILHDVHLQVAQQHVDARIGQASGIAVQESGT
jgi:L-malate glycosyltransferase